MWEIKRGKLVSVEKEPIESGYVHKDQLLHLETTGICESLAIFCPDNVRITKLPWQKYYTIDTRDWVLRVIKLDGMAMTIAPLTLKKISTVQELYKNITNRERKIVTNNDNSLQQALLFPNIDPDYS